MHKLFEYIIAFAIIAVAVTTLYKARHQPLPDRINRPITLDYYIDAHGNTTSLDVYHGDYVWIDYAAEWCSYCEPQTEVLKDLDHKYGDKLLFLTLITSTEKVVEAPTADSALSWADRFDLPLEKVLAYYSTKTLPYHILYSPEGEILHQGSGSYSAERIVDIIQTKTPLLGTQFNPVNKSLLIQ